VVENGKVFHTQKARQGDFCRTGHLAAESGIRKDAKDGKGKKLKA